MRARVYDVPSRHYYLVLLNNETRRLNSQCGGGGCKGHDVGDWYPSFKNMVIPYDEDKIDTRPDTSYETQVKNIKESKRDDDDDESEVKEVTGKVAFIAERKNHPLASSTPVTKGNNNFFSCCTH